MRRKSRRTCATATSAPDNRPYAFAGASAALTSDAPRSHRVGSNKQHFGFAGCAVSSVGSHRSNPDDALTSATGAAIYPSASWLPLTVVHSQNVTSRNASSVLFRASGVPSRKRVRAAWRNRACTVLTCRSTASSPRNLLARFIRAIS